jgi:primosomal protein N' (replication factor Y)
VATVTGEVDAVAKAVASTGIEVDDVLGPVDVAERAVRTIVRFDYARGAEVAAALRAQVVKAATARRRPGVARPTTNLKVRFDDVEPFLEA